MRGLNKKITSKCTIEVEFVIIKNWVK